MSFPNNSNAQTITYTSGSGNFLVPDGITTVMVSVWGAGGGGGYNNGQQGAAGGGGGAFTLATNYLAVPKDIIPYTVGLGGTGQLSNAVGKAGEPSTFGSDFPLAPTQVFASGGGRAGGTTRGTGGPTSFGLYLYRAGGPSISPAGGNSNGSGGGAAGNPMGSGAAPANNSGVEGIGANGSGSGGSGGTSGSELGKIGGHPGGGGGGGKGNNGGNGGNGQIIISWLCSNTLTSANNNQTVCLGTGIGNINYNIIGAYGATVTGLPAGVTPNYVNGNLTISGLPTVTGIFTYTVTPQGSCTGTTASGTITVNAPPTITAQPAPIQTICSTAAFSQISVTATGTALTYQWYTNTTGFNTLGTLISGATSASFTPPLTSAGTTNYYFAIVSGVCSPARNTAASQASVSLNKTVGSASSTPTVCTDSPISITHASTGATSLGTVTWLPSTPVGVSATLSGNTITISGNPTNPGPSAITYIYTIPVNGCGPAVNATGSFTVTPNNTAGTITSNTFCQGSALLAGVTQSTTRATGIGAATGLPPGVSVSWASNQITFTGTPTTFGTFNYTIPLTGGCGLISAAGTITVNAAPVVNPSSSFTSQSRCINTTAFNPLTVEARTGFNYQWYSNTTGSTSSGTQTPVGTNSNYFTPPNNVAGTKYYYVVVSSTSCSATVTGPQSAAIIVNPSATVSFTAQPAGPTACANTEVTYSTQTGQTGYVWTIPGVLNTDYTITSGGNGSSNLVIKWLTIGNKSVSVNYQDANGCGAISPAISNSITVQKNTVTPPSAYPSVCLNGTITPFIHTTTQATGIGVATGLPTGLSAAWSSNTITISGTIAGSVLPGFYNYSIPLTGGCGTVAATGTVEVTPVYTLNTITSVSPSSTGGTATVTITGDPTILLNGTYQVTYSMGLANTSGPTTTSVTVTNGKGVFSTTVIANEDLTSLTISQIKKVTDACFVPITNNNITFFGIRSAVYTSSGTYYVPAGIYQITIKVWGGGGGGGVGNQAGGGGGGGYSQTTIDVIPGEPIGMYIGQGGTGGSPGAISYATRDPLYPTSLVYANGGAGGTATAGGAGGVLVAGTFNFAGGTGGKRTNYGGSGGNGGGANGGLGAPEHNDGKSGVAGKVPGGGGSGGNGNGGNSAGGNGGNGLILISYPLPPVGPCFKVIDDGAKTGTTIIEFTCNTTWTAPQGLVGFNAIVGGAGAGGGSGSGSGGGGAGQLLTGLSYSTVNPYGFPAGKVFTLDIGQGGVGAISINEKGGPGGTSSISGSIDGSNISASAIGGGGGASRYSGVGMNGSSGGGGAASPTPVINYAGGAGLPSKGASGGRGDASGSGAHAGGGGGGIATVGLNGQGAGAGQGKGGDGGNGVQYTIADFSRNYGGGGGGIGNSFNGANKFNGEGGKVLNVKIGGDGNQDDANSIGYQGQDLTGSGGGAGFLKGGRGGNGVVYIYYDNFRILKVEYLYFNANYNPQTRSADLDWATSKEWENKGFEIERAVNNPNNWEKITEVAGNGYTDAPTVYSYTDTNLPASGGNVFYRLKQVDSDGSFSYSIVKSVQVVALKGKSNWVAYPNPSSSGDYVIIDLLDLSTYNDEPIVVLISDVKGVSKTYTLKQPNEIAEIVNAYLDQSHVGLYIVQLIWGDQSQQLKLMRK